MAPSYRLFDGAVSRPGFDGSGGNGARPGGTPGCEASYPDTCLDSGVEDYDCEGGTGDGPRFVSGPVTVDRDVEDPDPFDLDRDGGRGRV